MNKYNIIRRRASSNSILLLYKNINDLSPNIILLFLVHYMIKSTLCSNQSHAAIEQLYYAMMAALDKFNMYSLHID